MFKLSKTIKNTIPDGNYIGYLWRTSAQLPTIYDENNAFTLQELKPNNKVYDTIIEGQLYDKEKDTSIRIRFIDGNYHIAIIELGKLDDNFKFGEALEVPAINKSNNKNIKLKPLKQLKASTTNSEFKTWQTVANLFVGFSNPIKKS